MPSPYPVASLLGNLLFLVRHEPLATEHHAALLAALRDNLAGRGLHLEADADGLRVNGELAILDAPGTALVSEQMLLHGIRVIELAAPFRDEDLLRLMWVLAAFPGTYAKFADALDALGATASRLVLTQVTSEFEVFRAMPWRPRAPDQIRDSSEGAPLDLPDIRRDHADEFEKAPELSLDAAPEEAELAALLTGGTAAVPRPALNDVVGRGREAAARENWDALLNVALELVEAEREAPSEMAGSTYRIELRRLMSRKHLVMIAGFTHSDRRLEAITVLRRFPGEATEILMALLADGETINERRAYYSAITQISHGAEAVRYHLSHSRWYVVRNAADLCGELTLAEAVPDLIRQCQHEEERVRKAIAEALGRIGTPAALEGLRKILADPAPGVRRKALAYLHGRQARGMIGALGKLLDREEDEAVQLDALLALGRIATLEAVSLLGEWAGPGGKVLGKRRLAIRLAAAQGLALAGPVALNALTVLQRDDQAEVRDAATRAIDALKQ